jgi:hypothetical protein
MDLDIIEMLSDSKMLPEDIILLIVQRSTKNVKDWVINIKCCIIIHKCMQNSYTRSQIKQQSAEVRLLFNNDELGKFLFEF